MNVCFPYYRIFLYKKYNLDTNQNISISKYNGAQSQWESAVKFFDNLTVDEILKYSPNIDETIQDCYLRNVTPGEIISYSKAKECLKFLQVSKHVDGFFVCYRFILNTSVEGFDDAMIASDTMKPYVVSLIAFNMSLFNYVDQFMAFYNSKDSLPTEELIQATGLDRIFLPDNQVMYNNFGVRYRMDKIQNLEPPYTTRCRNSKRRDHYLTCVNESVVSKFNRMSSMSQHINGSLKLISGPLLQNITNFQKYFDIVQDCRNTFHWNDCNILVFTSSNDAKIRFETFQVYSMLPDEFDVLIGTRARLLFLDYMTLCFSCFGTWLGISVLGLNPFKWRRVQSVSTVQNESAASSRSRPMYQTQTIRRVLETLKQQEEFNLQLDQEVKTIRNEIKKMARKRPR